MEINNESSVPIISIEAAAPPIIVDPRHFGENPKDNVYTMAVRLKTKKVSLCL